MKDGLNAGTFSVGHAERRDIDSSWSNIKWNKNHFQIQYHRLYYPVSCDGRAKLRLLNKEIELLCGRVYFIPAFSIAESYIDGSMNKYFIHFQAESHFFDMYRYFSDTYSVPAGKYTGELFETVVRNYTDKSLAARMKVQGAMNMIMSDFASDLPLRRNILSRFEPVLDYVDGHFRERVSVSDLASIMNISEMYFSSFFKKTFNVSPKQYVLNKRLTEAQKLLLETNLSVKEIAYRVGFENENYFSEYFSAKVGVSALKFRNRELPERID